MDTVYIETSIVSYATARPSRDIQIAALQQQARDWWNAERPKFDLVTSQLTLDEAAAGDGEAASERLKLLSGLPLLDINSDVQALAGLLLASHMMPQKAAADALQSRGYSSMKRCCFSVKASGFIGVTLKTTPAPDRLPARPGPIGAIHR